MDFDTPVRGPPISLFLFFLTFNFSFWGHFNKIFFNGATDTEILPGDTEIGLE
jgi:hypothetical protein